VGAPAGGAAAGAAAGAAGAGAGKEGRAGAGAGAGAAFARGLLPLSSEALPRAPPGAVVAATAGRLGAREGAAESPLLAIPEGRPPPRPSFRARSSSISA
jgi:hypothetical protein